MARTWLQIKVELLGGLGGELEPPPGRVFAVAPSETFERFAEAINRAFGRWDFSHLHGFELADGRRIGFPDEEFGDEGWIDHATAKLGSALKPGSASSSSLTLVMIGGIAVRCSGRSSTRARSSALCRASR